MDLAWERGWKSTCIFNSYLNQTIATKFTENTYLVIRKPSKCSRVWEGVTWPRMETRLNIDIQRLCQRPKSILNPKSITCLKYLENCWLSIDSFLDKSYSFLDKLAVYNFYVLIRKSKTGLQSLSPQSTVQLTFHHSSGRPSLTYMQCSEAELMAHSNRWKNMIMILSPVYYAKSKKVKIWSKTLLLMLEFCNALKNGQSMAKYAF